jgi:ribosomal subunit interface protein
MTLRVSGKNLDIGQSLRTYVGTRIDCVVSKYSAGLTNGHVTIEREGSGFRTDCTLHLGSGGLVQVKAEAQEAYASFNIAAERIEKRLRRYKGKLKGRAGSDATTLNPAEPVEDEAVAEVADMTTGDGGDPRPVVIVESLNGLKEMSVSSAVKELDVTHSHVVVFRHVSDGRPNIVYRRADGNIGWVACSLTQGLT